MAKFAERIPTAVYLIYSAVVVDAAINLANQGQGGPFFISAGLGGFFGAIAGGKAAELLDSDNPGVGGAIGGIVGAAGGAVLGDSVMIGTALAAGVNWVAAELSHCDEKKVPPQKWSKFRSRSIVVASAALGTLAGYAAREGFDGHGGFYQSYGSRAASKWVAWLACNDLTRGIPLVLKAADFVQNAGNLALENWPVTAVVFGVGMAGVIMAHKQGLFKKAADLVTKRVATIVNWTVALGVGVGLAVFGATHPSDSCPASPYMQRQRALTKTALPPAAPYPRLGQVCADVAKIYDAPPSPGTNPDDPDRPWTVLVGKGGSVTVTDAKGNEYKVSANVHGANFTGYADRSKISNGPTCPR